jgi:ribonuclease D
VRVLATPEDLAHGLREIEGAPRYYIDTEFESSKRGKQLSLIQISRGEEVYVIDVLGLTSHQHTLGDLGSVIFAPNCEWVLHAGLQDIELLLAQFQQGAPPALFDTQVVWSLTGPEASVSLAFLQFKVLGVRSSKGYQADDWLRRPLPRAQLEYAATDIVHLPALERELRRRARELGREHVIADACRELLLPEPAGSTLLGFESFRNAWQLDGAGQSALRALIDWYNALGPGALALQSRTLLSIASRMPANMRELSRIKGVSPNLCRAHGAELVALLQRAKATAPAGEALEPVDYASFDDFVREARLSLVRAELCAELRIAPDLALPMAVVRRMQQRVKAAGDLRAAATELSGWRASLFGEAFARHLERQAPPFDSSKEQ